MVEALCYKPEDYCFESDEVTEFFLKLSNPTSRIMALGFSQPLIGMSTKRYFWERSAAGA
jgi:hypothetical protein